VLRNYNRLFMAAVDRFFEADGEATFDSERQELISEL